MKQFQIVYVARNRTGISFAAPEDGDIGVSKIYQTIVHAI